MPRRAMLAGVVLLFGPLAVLAPAHGAQSVPTEPSGRAERFDPAAAAVAAKVLRTQVEVVSRRTERERTFANPDGSWTLEQHVEAVRVRRNDGTWTPVDPTLRPRGGLIRPAATTADVRFSAGGSAPLATMRTEAGIFQMTWPAPLPAPRLEGDTAVYAEVLPGVDLALRATVDGFSHVLVVKNREAATSPAVRHVRFGLAGGLRWRSNADGGLEAVNRAGTVAVTAGEAAMWDSRVNGGTPNAGPTASSVAAPGVQARRAGMAVRIVDRALVIEPDEALLHDQGAVFPLYLDPSYAKGYKRFAYANSSNENNTTEVARVGRSPDSGAIYRSYFTFDVAPLRRTRILSAELHTKLVHSWSCTNTPVNLYRVAGHGSGRLAWSGPTLAEWIDERYGHAHKPSGGVGCADDPQPDMPMEFGNRMITEVQEAANAGWTEFPVGLSARRSDGTGESTQSWWKKFSLSSTKIVVVYNSAPNVPTSLSADGAGCATGTTRPFVSAASPVLRAVVSDPDGETDLRLGIEWQWWNTSVSPAVWQALGSDQQTGLVSGATGQVAISPALGHGQIYRWRAQARDPYAYGPYSGVDGSAWSSWCEFAVDLEGPSVEPGVSSPVYGADLNLIYGAVGRTADFTFTASGVADVASYRYGWADPPTTAVAAPSLGGSLTLPLTPPPPRPADPTSGGQLTLHVVSVDRAGRSSPLKVYPFNIGSATAPVGRWNMADPAGSTTLVDSSGGGRDASLSGGSAGAESRLLAGPTAVALDGVDDWAAANGVPADTATSFTVSAWVRPAVNSDGWRSAVAGSGQRASSFMLRRASDNRWSFAVAQTDLDNAALTNVYSTSTSKPGVWTHLTGVYDAGAKQIRLYVNGVLQSSAANPAAFAASGALEFGRAKWNGNVNWHQPWRGSLAEVRVWDRVLSAEEIAPMGATLAGRWRLDGDGSDATPFDRTATGPPTLAWVEDRTGLPGSAVALDGSTEWLTTAGPVLRTNQSFTVTAWVRLYEPVDHWANAVGQDGTAISAFYLGHRMNGTGEEWGFVLKDADTTGAGTWAYAQTPLGPDDIGAWVHLAGVWDADAGQARLYVDGVLRKTVARAGSWQAGGPLSIGRTWYPVAGVPGPTQPWPGLIDDVRGYQGVLSGSEIAKLAAQ